MRGTICISNMPNSSGDVVTRLIVAKKELPSKKKAELVTRLRYADYNDVLNNVNNNLIDVVESPVKIDLPAIPMVNQTSSFDSRHIHRLREPSTINCYIKDIFPNIVFSQSKIIGDVYYDIDNWLMFGSNPLCTWKPSIQNGIDAQSIKIDGDILMYSFKREAFLLLEGYARHKKVFEEEVLTVNVRTGESKLYLAKIRNKVYYRYGFIFDMNLRDWVCVSNLEQQPIYGFKVGARVV